MCHAFYCPSVQCCFMSDWQLGKGKDGKEGQEEATYNLSPETKTVLAIGHKELHYAVIELGVVEKTVMIWDFATPDKSHVTAKWWMEHVRAIIKMHCPGDVAESQRSPISWV